MATARTSSVSAIVNNVDTKHTYSCSNITVDNALTYLQKVEKALSDDEFSSFLEIIEDFKHQRYSVSYSFR